jgi:hypothetical protein
LAQPGDEEISLRELIARLIEAAKAYARAELELIKRTAFARAGQAVTGVGLGVAALLFVQAAVTVLLAALGMWIASAIGAAGGFAIAALAGLAIAALLGWLAARSFGGTDKGE